MLKYVFLLLMVLWSFPVASQPSCYGAIVNATTGVASYYALQYKASPPKSWICVLIHGGVPGPPGPIGPAGPPGSPSSMPPMLDLCSSPTQFWDGTQWNCLPNNFMTAQ